MLSIETIFSQLGKIGSNFSGKRTCIEMEKATEDV